MYSYKTSISFGLVHIPVSLHASVKNNDIGFNMIDRKTKSRVQYKKTCVDCDGRLVNQDDIIKGYEYEKDQYIFFDEQDFEKLKSKKDKAVFIEKFVSLREIDPIYYEKSFFVVPEKGADKAFFLLLAAMEKENKVGIAKTMLGAKENVIAIRAFGGQLILSSLYFYDEVQRNPAGNSGGESLSEKEIDIAKTIINNMTGAFKLEEYKDEYRERLVVAIKTKINGGKLVPMREGKTERVADLMDALRKTLESTKKEAKPKPKKAN